MHDRQEAGACSRSGLLQVEAVSAILNAARALKKTQTERERQSGALHYYE